MPDPLSSEAMNEMLAVANALADAARAPILKLFRSSALGADNKLADGFDPVTAADRKLVVVGTGFEPVTPAM